MKRKASIQKDVLEEGLGVLVLKESKLVKAKWPELLAAEKGDFLKVKKSSLIVVLVSDR